MDSIPLSRPDLGAAEERAVLAALRAGAIGGGGEIGRRVELAMAQRTAAPALLLVHSGTLALELAFQALDLPRGGKVILPSFTHPSSANAVLRAGLRPVFAECEPATMNLDPDDAAQRIDRDCVAILAVHYAGVACDLERLSALAARHGLALVEDAAHGFDARWRGRCLGTLGEAGALSFHATKNLVAGEGGALLLRDPQHVPRSEHFRDMGTDRSAFLRGERERYTWVSDGTCGVLSDLAAALLEAQLARADEILARRRAIAARYRSSLTEHCAERGIAMPFVPADCEWNAHLFWMRFPSAAEVPEKITALRARGVMAAAHFPPLHASPFAREFLGCAAEDLPRTVELAARLVRVPLSSALLDGEVEQVVAAVRGL